MKTESIDNLKNSARPAATLAAMVLAASILGGSPGNAEASSFLNEQRNECRQTGNNIERAVGNYARQGRNEAAALGNLLVSIAAPVVKNIVCDAPADNEQKKPQKSTSRTSRL